MTENLRKKTADLFEPYAPLAGVKPKTTCLIGKHSNNKHNLLQNLDLSNSVVVVVVLLFYVHGKHLR